MSGASKASKVSSGKTRRRKLMPVIVCTVHRGVFFGYINPAKKDDRTLRLEDGRMAITWGTSRGLMQLAETGPTIESVIGARATIEALHDVIAVIAVSKEAEKRWKLH